jgi:hypothetical protein
VKEEKIIPLCSKPELPCNYYQARCDLILILWTKRQFGKHNYLHQSYRPTAFLQVPTWLCTNPIFYTFQVELDFSFIHIQPTMNPLENLLSLAIEIVHKITIYGKISVIEGKLY